MTIASSRKAQLCFDARATLGEGPVWDKHAAVLYWVDIEGCMLHRHDPETGENDSWEFDGMLGAVMPVVDGNLLVAHEKGLMHFDPGTGDRKFLNLLANNDDSIRFNDGKCDPNGNLWIGTMDKDLKPGRGTLYRVDRDQRVAEILRNTSISNGMAWSADQKYYYYIDSPTLEVWRFDYDTARAEVGSKKIAFKIPEEFGTPDGMTIDRDGMLWIAHWGGSCVRQWDPSAGKVLQKIAVDAPQVTSCCFGGKELDMLYITTARGGLSAQELKSFPLSGALFCCALETKGTPVSYCKINL